MIQALPKNFLETIYDPKKTLVSDIYTKNFPNCIYNKRKTHITKRKT